MHFNSNGRNFGLFQNENQQKEDESNEVLKGVEERKNECEAWGKQIRT